MASSTCPRCAYANPPQADFCVRCGTPLHPAYTQERRWVTVLFFDLSRFTEYLLAHPLEDTWRTVDGALQQAAQEVRDRGGTVDKFFGDGLLAVFGAQRSQENDAEAALEAARSMVASSPLPARVGVASGLVLRTPLGGGMVGDQTVLGPAVNLAQRLSAAAPPGEVWCDEVTVRLVPRARVEAMPAQVLKGYAEPLAPLSYLGLREEPPQTVGREYELEQLAAALEAVRQGRPRRVVIHGPMGVGKTHLVQHFLRNLPQGVRGLIAPRVGNSTALRQAIRQGLEPFVKGNLAQWVQGMDPGEPSEVALAYTLGLIDQLDLEPGDLERYLIEGWRAALQMLSQQSPLVLVLEDLHATEPAILEFTRQAPEGRVLLLMTARRNRWSPGPDLQILELAPLSLQEAQRLAQIWQPGLEPRRSLALAGLSAGFPLVLRALITHPQGEPEPTPFYQPRLDSLPRLVRQALYTVAVLGDGTPLELLRFVLGDDVDLSRLEAEGFVEMGEQGLEFAVPFLREAVLGHVSAQQAKDWHLQAARWYQHKGRLFESARHLEAAGDSLSAFRFWRLAAQRSWAEMQYDRAFGAYREALRLAEGNLQSTIALEMAERLLSLGRFAEAGEVLAPYAPLNPLAEALRAEALFERGMVDEALATFPSWCEEPRAILAKALLMPQATQLLPAELPQNLRPLACLRQGQAALRQRNYAEAIPWLQAYVQTPEPAPYREALGRLELARALWRCYRPGEALQLLQDFTPNPELPVGLQLEKLCEVAALQMDHALYRQTYTTLELMARYLQSAPPAARARAYAMRLRYLLETGYLEEAVRWGERACDEIDEGWLRAHLALAHALAPGDEHTRALERLAQALRHDDHPDTHGLVQLALGMRAWHLGFDPRKALKVALVAARRHPNPWVYHRSLLTLGLYHSEHNPTRALYLARHLMNHTGKTGFTALHELARLLRVQLELEQGREVLHLLQFQPSNALSHAWRAALLRRLGQSVPTSPLRAVEGYGILGAWLWHFWQRGSAPPSSA